MEENYFIHFMKILENVGTFLQHLLHEAQSIEDTARIKDVMGVIFHDAEIKFDGLYGAGKWAECLAQAEKENQSAKVKAEYKDVENYFKWLKEEGQARKREEMAAEALERRTKANREAAKRTKAARKRNRG
jgi:hypothetical protein